MSEAKAKPEKAKKPKADKSAKAVRESRHVGFVIETVHRSQLKNCGYNPRVIRDDARRRLRANLKRVGLTHPITWNRRTGNIVGGHQRVAIIDGLEGTKDYTLPVAVVDLSLEDEQCQNIHENNSDAMGDWDLALVERLVKEDRIDIEKASMDVAATAALFGDDALGASGALVAEMAEKVREAQASYDKLKGRQAKKDQADYYRVVVFRDAEQADELSQFLEMPGAAFLPGDQLMARVRGDE
jgi:hypothetical protein